MVGPLAISGLNSPPDNMQRSNRLGIYITQPFSENSTNVILFYEVLTAKAFNI